MTPRGRRVSVLLASAVLLGLAAFGGWSLQSQTGLVVIDAHESTVCRLAFSPAGEVLASASRDGRIRVWSTDGGALGSFETGVSCEPAFAFTADGRRLVAGAAGPRAGRREASELRTWTWATGAQESSVPLGSHDVTAIACSPNGKLLAVAIYQRGDRDEDERVIQVRAVEDGSVAWTFPSARVRSIAVTPKSEFLVVVESGEAAWISLQLGRRTRILEDVQHAALAPDGKTVAVSKEGALFLAQEPGAPGPRVAPLAVERGDGSSRAGLAFLQGDERLASASGTEVLVHERSGKLVRRWTAPAEIGCLAASPDGRWIAAGASDGKVYLLRASSRFSIGGPP